MMDRRAVLSLAAAAAVSTPSKAAAAFRARNVVLVHGAYADGSSWSRVIPHLQAAGLNVAAVQNPLRTLAEDCDYTRRILALQDGPTVLVAHSYGGEVITEVGIDPKVSALVYCSARAPDAGEDYAALAKTYPTPPAPLVRSGGYAGLSEEVFVRDFADGLDAATAKALFAVQGRISDELFQARVTQAAWRSRPTFYQVAKLDRIIDPDLQRFMAGRMKAKTVELAAGHLGILTHAREVADLILQAARA